MYNSIKKSRLIAATGALPLAGYEIRVVSLSVHMYVGATVHRGTRNTRRHVETVAQSVTIHKGYNSNSAAGYEGRDQRPPRSCGETQLGVWHG